MRYFSEESFNDGGTDGSSERIRSRIEVCLERLVKFPVVFLEKRNSEFVSLTGDRLEFFKSGGLKMILWFIEENTIWNK